MAHVGGAAEVLVAGAMGLDSTCACIRIRREPDSVQPAQWVVQVTPEQRAALEAIVSPRGLRFLALMGDYLSCIELVARAKADLIERYSGSRPEIRYIPASVHASARPWIAEIGWCGRTTLVSSHASEAEAKDAAIAEWRRHRDERVEKIRRARGGTLDWGLSVEPLDEPIVLPPPARRDDHVERVPADVPPT